MRIPLAPPPGIISDETTFASPGTWADGNNVRFWRGRPEVIGGYESANATALGGVCRGALAWTTFADVVNIGFGTNDTLEVMSGGGIYDITPSGLTAGNIDGAGGPGYGLGGYGEGTYGSNATTEWFARTWSLASYGEWLIANPRIGSIYSWEGDTGADAVIVANAPTEVTCILVTPERQLLAFGCNEEVSTDYNPMCIRGSDLEDITDWTTTAANNAFEHILEGGCRIVSARLFGPYVAIWTDTGCHLGQFVGETGQAYRFDLVADNCGLIGPNAVTVFNQVAYWVTPDLQVYQWQVGAPPAPVPFPVSAEFRENVVEGQSEKIVVSHNGKFGEIWIDYPDSRDGIENSRYLAFSTFDGAWFPGIRVRTFAIDAGPTRYPLAVDYSGNLYWHEKGETANGAALEWFIKSSDFYLADGQRWVEIQGVWSDFERQEGNISLTVYVRAYPQSEAVEKGPYTLATTTLKSDFRASGRIAAMEFSGSSAPAFMRLGTPSFEAVVTGER